MRCGHARPGSSAPVRQSRAREVHRTRSVLRRARVADQKRRINPRAAGAAVSDDAPVHGRHGIASAKTYDIEVWLPSQQGIAKSSCSNTKRSRRAVRRSVPRAGTGRGRARLHTLNGSGWRWRTLIAIVEELPAERWVSGRAGSAAAVHGHRRHPPDCALSDFRPPAFVVSHTEGKALTFQEIARPAIRRYCLQFCLVRILPLRHWTKEAICESQ